MLAVSAGLAISGSAVPAQPSGTHLSGPQREFDVLATSGASLAAAEDAVRGLGATVLDRNAAVGLLSVRAPATGFREAAVASQAIVEAAPVRALGSVPRSARSSGTGNFMRDESAMGQDSRPVPTPNPHRAKPDTTDPLDERLWGLSSVRSDLARSTQAGDERVLVGVLDTGVDGKHPDLTRNFNRGLSRNFVRDIPVDTNGATLDGPCEFRGCVDPPDHDDYGHGTHVAGTIAAAADRFGISGVAPEVSLVNIRVAQDSGYVFLRPVVDALTYASKVGIDVVNMSFYIDPWLYNCRNHAGDSPDERAQQRMVINALGRALSYAHQHDITMVSSLGNAHTDIGAPLPDTLSPSLPIDTARKRVIDNDSCLAFPAEDPHVIAVSALGPSNAKADYSNYGTERVSVSAPGGYARDYLDTPWFNSVENKILSTYPRNVALIEGDIDSDGNITEQGKKKGVQRSCKPSGVCGYYQYVEGSSMASPHAAGVAALIASQYGSFAGNGATMNPDAARRVLENTAASTTCPTPRTVSYEDVGRPAEFTATCEGPERFNGFYGHGLVDAYAAVTRGSQYLGR